MNDIGINECSISVLCYADLKGDHWFMVTARTGVTKQMIKTTIAQYLRGQAVCAELRPYDDAWNDVQRWQEPPPHNEARVTVWRKNWVKEDDSMWLPQLNVCTEYTSARDIVDLQHTLMGGIELFQVETDVTIWGLPHTSRQAAPNSPVQRQKVSTHTSAPQMTQNGPMGQIPTPGGNTMDVPAGVIWDGEIPVIESWSYKLQDDYERLFVGQTIGVKVGRVRRMLADNREGTETYDTIQFHPYYNGEPDKERRCLRIYINDRENNYDWKTFKKHWEQYFAVVGADLQGEGLARFKLNKSGDRVYWNFVGLRFEDESAAPEPEYATSDIPWPDNEDVEF